MTNRHESCELTSVVLSLMTFFVKIYIIINIWIIDKVPTNNILSIKPRTRCELLFVVMYCDVSYVCTVYTERTEQVNNIQTISIM